MGNFTNSNIRSIIVNHLEQSFQQGDFGVAYIYCNHTQRDLSDTELICSILEQLIHYHAKLSTDIVALYESCKTKEMRPSFLECAHLLQSEIYRFSKVFIVIDALGDYSPRTRQTLLDEINIVPNTHILVTARCQSSIEGNLPNDAQLEIRATHEDIIRYLKNRMHHEPRLARYIQGDPELKDFITRTIVEKTQGMHVPIELFTSNFIQSL